MYVCMYALWMRILNPVYYVRNPRCAMLFVSVSKMCINWNVVVSVSKACIN